jgi:GNAT superfamily N-acetyltransferase
MREHWTEFNRHCASASVRGSIRKGPGIEAVWSNTALIINNLTAAAGDRPITSPVDLRDRAQAAMQDAEGSSVPWMFGMPEVMFPAGLDIANPILDNCGLQHMMYMTVMECEGPLQPPLRPLPDDVEIRRIQTPEQAFDALHLNSSAYGMPHAVTDDVLASRSYFSNPQRDFGFVVYNRDGIAVSTATALILDNWAYIAAVATHPGHRQKGYAEAALRKAVEAAGCSRTALDASRMGQPLYAQMGYRPLHRWNFWIPKPA